MNDHGVVHFEIPATDPDKLSAFYKDLFGWSITKMSMGDTEYWPIETTAADPTTHMPTTPGAINGGMYKRMAPEQRPVNYVNIESVDQYIEKAKGLGASVVVPRSPVPQMGWFALLIDPDGNPIGLWQTDPSAA